MSKEGLWGGRFSSGPSELFKQFNDSFRFDVRLLQADIQGSRAYAQALCKKGILSAEEQDKLLAALDELASKYPDETAVSAEDLLAHEDVHSFVESELVQKVGDIGKKLHTARSRNDQVATDLRIYTRTAIDQSIACIKDLQKALLEKAEAHQDVALPGYTHLQKAQPILWAHYLLSFVEMFERDIERLQDCRKRVNRLPLGSGALAGNSQSVDREFLATTLGFDGITRNSLDATSDRDFVVEYLAAASLFMVHLSRLSEDLILYCSSEFAYVEMSDQVATGSSLMPQKKNPDALELLRGKSGRTLGHLTGMLNTLKGLPSCYNKDLQEDKEGLFDTVDTLLMSAQVAALVVSGLKVKEETMQKAASSGYLNATELADYLVSKEVPFRTAHHLVGEIVLFAIKEGAELHELSLESLKSFHDAIEEDVFQALSLESTLQSKASLGGTSPSLVKQALQEAKSRL